MPGSAKLGLVMKANTSKQLKNLSRDPLFWLALLAGPAVWLILYSCFPTLPT